MLCFACAVAVCQGLKGSASLAAKTILAFRRLDRVATFREKFSAEKYVADNEGKPRVVLCWQRRAG